jgi:predicted secreted protein
MKLGSAIAIYFITWWVCLFMVLPWGVRNAHEAGEAVEQGNEHGAPVKPMLWRKVLATTILSAIVFAAIYGQMTYHWVGFDDIPGVKAITSD